MIFNMVGGGGGSLKATDALLRVEAPAGSTVTITKGSVTKTDLGHENADDNAIYDYYFIIHSSQFDANAWTVTATLGGDSATATIVINAADEYDVVLSYYAVGDLIPVMTSATTPSGEVTASSYNGTSYPYLAFDGNTSTHWWSGQSSDYTNRYIQYDFGVNVKITSVYISMLNFTGSGSKTRSFTILTSTDGTNFDEQYSENVTCPASTTTLVEKTMPISTTICRYLRIKQGNITAESGNYSSFQLCVIQARNDV